MTDDQQPETLNRNFTLRGPAAEYFQYEGREALLEGGTRCGKGGPLWETVWTPTGAKTLGELAVGDEVLGGDGGTTRVTHIHELGEQSIFRVEFSTGEEVFTTRDHLWRLDVRPNHKTNRVKSVLMTTSDLDSRLKSTTRFDAWVPMATANFAPQERDLPIHPYVLGVLLGDGCFRGGSVFFTSADEEISERVGTLWPFGVKTWGNGISRSLPRAKPLIEALGLWGKKSTEKWIPKQYMYASVSARMELLRGLMDTDGTVDRASGMPRFAVSCFELAQDFLTVVQSLGGAGHIRTKATAKEDSHSVSFWYDNPVELFALSRKRALCKARSKFKTKRLVRRITEMSAPEPARCITVEAEDGLYMTNAFIVTHNSYAFLIKAKMTADLHPGSRQLICRQTRKSLNESILRDWREDILWIGHPAVSGTASKEHQDEYRWKNGSVVYFAGLENMRDTASPILSTKWDRIYVCQAEETSANDWEILATRLSSFKAKYHQLTADCNPASPSHWLNTRFAPDRQSLDRRRYPFRHYDNPFFYKGLYPNGEWTKEGKEYVSILESTLTGIRRARFLESKWVAAEGQILDNWDPRVNSVDAELVGSLASGYQIVPRGASIAQLGENPIRVAYFTCGVDWGWNPDPGAMSLWAYDSPRWHPLVRRFRVAEVMKLKWQRDDWADVAEEWWARYGVKYFSCDPSDPENISYFNLRLSKKGYRDAPKAAIKCPPIGGGHRRSKNNSAGIDLMREGIRGAKGHVRSYFLKDAFPLGVDEELRRTGRATCFEQEVESWVYALDAQGNPTEKPSKERGSHANAIYAAMYDETLNYARGFGKADAFQERPAPDTVDYLLWKDKQEEKERKRRHRRRPW